jgi:hypothetical protein
MKKVDCLFERASHVGVGLSFLLMAMGLSVIGITVLPFFGLLAAAPVFFLSAFFFAAPKSRECTIS